MRKGGCVLFDCQTQVTTMPCGLAVGGVSRCGWSAYPVPDG